MIFAGKCHSQNCWPERAGFLKLNVMRSLQEGKTSFTRLCPVTFIAWISFISFDIQSSRFHSKHISSSKILRTTHYKHCVYVFPSLLTWGSLCQPHSLSRGGISSLPLPQVHLCRIPRDPLLADPCSILPKHKKNICFSIIFINYWHISSISLEVDGRTGEPACWISVRLLPK